MVSLQARGRAVAFFAAALVALAATAGPQASAGTVARTSLRTDTQISAEASRLSGRTLTVICARTSLQWQDALTAVGLPAASADEYYGFSLIPQGAMYLSPYVCKGLSLGASPSLTQADELQVGWSVDVLLHESTHLGRFTYDEKVAEACARVGLPEELQRLLRVTYHSAEMRRLTLAAAAFRSTQGAAYRGGTCP